MKIAPYAKSLVAALIAGLGALQVALVDNNVSTTEWIVVASAFLTGLGITYAVPNTPKEAPAADLPDAAEEYDTSHAPVPEDYEVDDTGKIVQE
jgi:hypothetical protein